MQPRTAVDPAKAEQALFEELDRVRASEVSAEELQKAKNQLLTAFYRSLKTIAGKANLLGTFEVFLGDYGKLNSYRSDLEKVTAANSVAKRYYQTGGLTFVLAGNAAGIRAAVAKYAPQVRELAIPKPGYSVD